MQLELAYAPFTCALISYLQLAEAGADFTVRTIDFRRGEHVRPEFLQLNPKHKVPVLIVDGEPLTETVAIGVWIARRFPAARLLPADPMDEIRALSLMAWVSSTIHPTLTPNALPQRYCDLPGSEDSVRRCAHTLTHEQYAIGERLLAGRDWFFDHLTCPDLHFFWAFRRGQLFGLDVSAYPACRAHFERISARPSGQRLLAFEASVLAAQAQRA